MDRRTYREIQEILERRVEKSALILRKLLGKILLEPVRPNIGKPYLKATSSIQALALLEIRSGSEGSGNGAAVDPDTGSNSLQWWTRSQRIGTLSEIPFEAAILDTGAPPVYQQIAHKANELHQLGLSASRIAKRLGVTDKTVTKGVAWIKVTRESS